MTKLSDYYSSNHEENPYTMEACNASSRVHIITDLIRDSVKPGAKILDVGCGDMYLSKVMPEYDWTGVDVNPTFNKGKAIICDIESPPYPFQDEHFDAVVCSEVLEHVYDPVVVTKEIHRVLKTGGTYILSTPNHDFIDHHMHGFEQIVFSTAKSWTKEHIHQYTKESHSQILAAAGFKSFFYTGADPHQGEFFSHARGVLQAFLMQNAGLPETPAQIMGDKLLSEAFRDFLHTIVVKTQKE